MKRKRQLSTPEVGALEAELRRERKKLRIVRTARNTLYTLLVVAAVSVLVATLLTPVLRILGHSMSPTLEAGQYVVSLKGSAFQQGDLVSFYIGNNLLVKRVIALPGDWVDIRADGTVLVNGVELEEPYLGEKAFGNCDLELPYQVPENKYFLMGDDRAVSQDSRSTVIGCIAKDQIVGKIVLCIWPLSDFGLVR
jgi:signal peptidase I